MPTALDKSDKSVQPSPLSLSIPPKNTTIRIKFAKWTFKANWRKLLSECLVESASVLGEAATKTQSNRCTPSGTLLKCQAARKASNGKLDGAKRGRGREHSQYSDDLPGFAMATSCYFRYHCVISCFTFSKGCKPELEPEDQEAQSKQLQQPIRLLLLHAHTKPMMAKLQVGLHTLLQSLSKSSANIEGPQILCSRNVHCALAVAATIFCKLLLFPIFWMSCVLVFCILSNPIRSNVPCFLYYISTSPSLTRFAMVMSWFQDVVRQLTNCGGSAENTRSRKYQKMPIHPDATVLEVIETPSTNLRQIQPQEPTCSSSN